MKCLILALLAAFSITASAGTTINCKGLNASGDPLKGLNVSKGHPKGNCADDGAERAGKPTKDQVVQPVEATTIKSSKSNSSERQQAPAEATTVKGSKSNSDNRLQANPTVMQGQM